ncbi:MAG: TonB-dependent receptor [Leadbetterella sp.]|nr:TonB-dependent receptor [Leadbetterella sp.]
MNSYFFKLRRWGKLCFVLLLGTAFAAIGQNRVSGTVTDKNGEPVIGASIQEKGTTNATATDVSGRFSLSVPQNAVLQVSFLGYISREIPVGNRTTLEITLEEDSRLLDEVVVVGFGTQKKVNLTGAVGVIDSKAFESVPVQNAVQALQGRIAGLNITQPNGGALNSRAGIDVRGLATIGQGSSGGALILIDGMEGDLFTLNPQDIENITVLKDAAASSIYGSRAPFGVILVTTKKGKQGKVTVNYNNSFRYNSAINMPKEMDSYTWATYFNEASINAGWGDVIAPEQMQRIRDYMDGKITTNTIPNPGNPNTWSNGYELANDNIDYYSVFYKKMTQAQEHNISVAGGTERTSYYVSGNYLDQGGLMNFGSDGLKRYNLFGKVEARLSDKATINYNARFIRSDYHQPRHMSNSFFKDIGRQSWPIGPLYDPNGFLFNDHALTLRDGGEIKNQGSTTFQQLGLTFEPLKGLRLVGTANYRNDTNFNHEDGKPIRQMQVNGVNFGNEWYYNWVSEFADKTDYLNLNAYADYEMTLQKNHYFKLMGGFQTEHNNYRDLWGSKDGIMVFDVPTINTTSGMGRDGDVIPPRVTGGYSSWATAGFFSRLNYNFAEKYLFEANLRYDGTSRFREERRWGLFPSFSAGWNVAREDFFQPLENVVTSLKVRGSYGSLGNQNTNSLYPTYTTMGYATSSGSWLIDGARPNISWAPGLISRSLTWEEIRSWNVGLDFGLLKNRLTGSFDYFVRKTLNMVGPADELPVVLGTGVPVTNNTDLKTKGFELELAWHDKVLKDLNYGLRFVLSDAVGEITRYSNPSGTLSQYYAGMKWGQIWGYETVGIAKTNEEMNAHLSTLTNGGQSNLGSNWMAGDIMYADLNGDGKINSGAGTIDDHGDLRVIGNSTPRFNFGFDITADWKGFDLSVFLQGVGKRDYFQGSFYFWGADNTGRWNSMGLVQHEDYFRNDPNHPLGLNTDGYYPRPLWGTGKNQQVQTRYLQNAAYLRLKNLQLGYSLPSSLVQKAGMSKVRLFVSGQNLLTITKMTTLFDPETIGGNSHGNVYPLTKVYSFGLNVTF